MLTRFILGIVSTALLFWAGAAGSGSGKGKNTPISGDPTVAVIQAAPGASSGAPAEAIAVSADGVRAYLPSADGRKLLDAAVLSGQVARELNLGQPITRV